MSDLFLDLRNHSRIVDFLVETAPFGSKTEQAAADKLVLAYQDGKMLPPNALADAARELAESTWPARYALHRFFSEEGRATEWSMLAEALRPSTAHLVKRLHASAGNCTVDEALASSDADIALGEDERYEIESARRHLREVYWKEHSKTLATFVKEGMTLKNGYEHRFGKMRDLAVSLPNSLSAELLSKVTQYEDRVWFEGRVIPTETLDKELEYYVEQKEISPLEG